MTFDRLLLWRISADRLRRRLIKVAGCSLHPATILFSNPLLTQVSRFAAVANAKIFVQKNNRQLQVELES